MPIIKVKTKGPAETSVTKGTISKKYLLRGTVYPYVKFIHVHSLLFGCLGGTCCVLISCVCDCVASRSGWPSKPKKRLRRQRKAPLPSKEILRRRKLKRSLILPSTSRTALVRPLLCFLCPSLLYNCCRHIVSPGAKERALTRCCCELFCSCHRWNEAWRY